MKKRDDINWFYINFISAPLETNKIESYIYEQIIQEYDNKYKILYKEEFELFGLNTLSPNKDDIMKLFAMLNYKGVTISLVLDNVDQKSYVSPRYQEKVFELAQHLTPDLRTITILNLREESFFRATRSGVLDAYLVPKFLISSPTFEDLIRRRMHYAIELLQKDDDLLSEYFGRRIEGLDKSLLISVFKILLNSIRRNRRVGKEILRFLNDISGGNMRQALRFFNTFMTSANTDVNEMLYIESLAPKGSPDWLRYQIPLHHIIKSIILGENKYYSSSRSFVFNIFQLNPAYTNSHFLSLKILDYLHTRINHFFKLDTGFLPINFIMQETEIANIAPDAVKYSISNLALYGLIEFDNQNKEGFETAEYMRITQTGKYYIENLIYNFTYCDLMSFDTLIADEALAIDIKSKLVYDEIKEIYERTSYRFSRTKSFINYLLDMENMDFERNPFFLNTDLTNKIFIPEIKRKIEEQEKAILGKMILNEEQTK